MAASAMVRRWAAIVDFRVATQPTVHGENVVLRILDKSKSLVTMESLGFSEHNLELIKRCLEAA
jgi:type II secretory ATPase GspE/PulE/Tfp pilus assembly ATPase PilB-like protein